MDKLKNQRKLLTPIFQKDGVVRYCDDCGQCSCVEEKQCPSCGKIFED